MTNWICMSDRPDNGGFKLQMRLEQDREAAEIRLLLNGIEVAHGPALTCAEQQFIKGFEPNTHKERSYDLHEEDVEWIEKQMKATV
jgi:hypothetical protein